VASATGGRIGTEAESHDLCPLSVFFPQVEGSIPRGRK